MSKDGRVTELSDVHSLKAVRPMERRAAGSDTASKEGMKANASYPIEVTRVPERSMEVRLVPRKAQSPMEWRVAGSDTENKDEQP